MKKYTLTLHLEVDLGEDLRLSANNPLDLTEYLLREGYSDIQFSDLESIYGTCTFKQKEWENRVVAKCFYVEKI